MKQLFLKRPPKRCQICKAKQPALYRYRGFWRCLECILEFAGVVIRHSLEG